MKLRSPLRFLGSVVGGWACLRIAMLVPFPAGDIARADQPNPPTAREPEPRFAGQPPHSFRAAAASTSCRACGPESTPASLAAPSTSPTFLAPPPVSPPAAAPTSIQAVETPPFSWFEPAQIGVLEPQPLAKLPAASRWSASAWAFIRRGEAQSLAAGGMLGGSQIGARISYRINGDPARPLALSARLYSPAGRPKGAEAALGLEWKPLAGLPVGLLAERRQALGREGRSAFSLTAFGGAADVKLLGPVRLDFYAQAGIVGIRSRDLFADGSARLGIPLGDAQTITFGAGLWGAAQPGASRLDAGPSLSWRLPVQGRNVRVTADWRMKLAGDASPGSGPTLTVGTDF